ncbi:MAG: hypothetical protein AAFY11_12015 [Cyanobacteria bacterium J06641_5]
MHKFDLALAVSITWLLATGGAAKATPPATKPIESIAGLDVIKFEAAGRKLAPLNVALPEKSTPDNSHTSDRVDLSPVFLENPFFLDKIGRRTATPQVLAASFLLIASSKLRARAKMLNSNF